MKGGVGKTTLSANLFRVLFERRQAGTLLLDLDPQFNLTQTLYTRPKYDSLKSTGKTIASLMRPPAAPGLFVVKSAAEPVPEPKSLAQTFFHFPKNIPPQTLDLVPGGFSLVKYSLMNDQTQLDQARNKFVSFVDKAKSQYKLICIDCNPSSSFLTLCALHVCTHILVPVRADRYSILGLEILSEFVDGVPSISPKPQFIVVLNAMPRSPTDEAAVVEAELRGHPEFGSRTLANSVPFSGHLKARTDYTGFAADRRGPWTSVLKTELAAVADELAGKLGV